MIHGIYTARTDGDWDFAVALDMDRGECYGWLTEIIEWYRSEGEEVVTIHVGDLAELPDVLTAEGAQKANSQAFKPTAGTEHKQGG